MRKDIRMFQNIYYANMDIKAGFRGMVRLLSNK